MSQLYTKAQWAWCWERYCEGYTIKTISQMLYVNRETVRQAFIRLGYLPEVKKDLEPLKNRRAEFLELGEGSYHS